MKTRVLLFHEFFLEKLRKEIGYNLIITKKFTMLVPLIRPYRTYNSNDLYLDGLAFLGIVSVARVAEPFRVQERNVKVDRDELVKEYLARSTLCDV